MSASRRENSLLSQGYEQSSIGRWGLEERSIQRELGGVTVSQT